LIWLAVAVYAGWLFVMTWALLRSISGEQAADVPVSLTQVADPSAA
jgi:hypothetical protein